MMSPLSVIPAKAGTQANDLIINFGDGSRRVTTARDRRMWSRPQTTWIPAFAGMTCVAIAMTLLTVVAPARAQTDCTRSENFASVWTRLDAARGYRNGFAEPEMDPSGNPARRRGNKSYEEIKLAYPAQQAEFRALLDLFAARLDDTRASVAREAVCGFRETLSEIMAGESLIGNDRLLQGLRTRYPGVGDPDDPDQRTLLTQANTIFRNALELAAERIRQGPERLRSSGIVNPNFRFFVENTPRAAGLQGEIVEDDYFRFTDLVVRAGLAGNSLAKRMFFQGNDDREERANAAAIFQRTAQSVYLSAALLGAGQSPRDFQSNNGNEVKRQVNDAQQTFSDILDGFNPLTLRGDFVPNQPTDNLLAGLRELVVLAQARETAAKTLSRRYDEDQTALTEELRNQTTEFLDQLDILISIVIRPGDPDCNPPDETNCDMTKDEDREKILALTRDPVYLCGPQIADDELDCTAKAVENQGGCDATICTNYQAYIGARIDLLEAEKTMLDLVDQIRIEQERSGTVVRLIRNGASDMAAMEFAQGVAVAITPDLQFDPMDFGWPTQTFAPSAAVAGTFEAGKVTLQSFQDVALEQTESTAAIDNIKLQIGTQAIAVERAKLAVIEAHRNYTASIGDLVRFIRNAAGTREELAQAYFTNPAYRLQLERAQRAADASFEESLVNAYVATKALEYEWSERLLNPIPPQSSPGEATPIGGTQFDPIHQAESVFATASAGSSDDSPTPTLQDYVLALQQWDIKMRDLRGPIRQPGQTVTISLKRDIFGYDSADEAFNRLAFRNRIAKGRRPGVNPDQDDLIIEFPLHIGDAKLLPGRANLKIFNPDVISFCQGGISANLRTVPGRNLRRTPSNNPPLVDLIMHDEFVVRTFFSKFDSGGQDDFRTVRLGDPRDAGQSLFAATDVQATIDCQEAGCRSQVTPNCQLANRSPAVSRWELRIRGDNGVNSTLDLQNLDDIEILLTYSFGQPKTFMFPEF